jgi:hypothetical protein
MKEDKNQGLASTVLKLKTELIHFFLINKKESLLLNIRQIDRFTQNFIEIYDKRPVENNIGGAGLIPNYWLFVMARWLKPTLIIESGVWKGQTSWLLRQARPTAEIHAFDINLKNLQYKDKTISYHEYDWINSDIRNKNHDEGLVFFDDHINQAKRVREAYKRGFKWLIFDDNVPTDQIYKIGVPALPSIDMLFDAHLKEGDMIGWELNGKKYSYVFKEKDTFGARRLSSCFSDIYLRDISKAAVKSKKNERRISQINARNEMPTPGGKTVFFCKIPKCVTLKENIKNQLSVELDNGPIRLLVGLSHSADFGN